MLTPDQISALGEAARKITGPISEYLIQDIARRVAEAGQLTSTAQYQVWRAQQLGVSQREIKQELRKRLGLSHREIRRIMYQSAQSGYDLDVRRFPYVQALPFARNASLQQIVAAAVELAQADFTNLTRTLGMVDPFGNALPLQDAYRSCTDFAFQQVVTGVASYTEAIRQATRNLAEKGVRTIDYQSGVHTSLEAAVRRNILGGLGLMQEQVSRVTHDQLGCNGWEISAHANSAPDHEPIQGKQYPDREYEALNSALRRRIGTLNCGHTAFPIILGISRPQHSREELEKFRADNEKGVTVDGVHYTGYEATQMQRKLERSIRMQKRRCLVDEAAGDTEKLAQDQSKLTLLRQRYVQFSKDAGLKTQYERTEVAGFGRKVFAKQAKSDIIKEKNELSFVIGRSLGAMAKNYDIVDKQTGIIYRFVEGTRVRNATVFAGYKGVKPLRPEVIEGLVAEYGGSADKWQHAKGIGTLDVDGEEIEAEVHWFQEETVGKVKFKVKEWLYD